MHLKRIGEDLLEFFSLATDQRFGMKKCASWKW